MGTYGQRDWRHAERESAAQAQGQIVLQQHRRRKVLEGVKVRHRDEPRQLQFHLAAVAERDPVARDERPHLKQGNTKQGNYTFFFLIHLANVAERDPVARDERPHLKQGNKNKKSFFLTLIYLAAVAERDPVARDERPHLKQ